MTTTANPDAEFRPVVTLPTIFRLGLFNLGLGLMSVLTLAVLNRVMISELFIPATLTAGTAAIQYLIAPVRVWFGQLSDTKPLFGLHRTNYVRIGVICAGICVFLAAQIAWQLGMAAPEGETWAWNSGTIAWSVLLALVFIAYGFSISASSIPFTALLVDVSDEKERARIVAIVWSMLLVGIVIGGITGKIWGTTILGEEGETSVLTNITDLYQPLTLLFIMVPIAFIVLANLATWGVERRYSRFSQQKSTSQREDSVTLQNTLQLLTSNRQVGIFFSFLFLLTVGLFLQEAVLEPYGGEIFKMPIGETTALNSVWGTGVLLGYGLTGFLVIPRLGNQKAARWGCGLVALCFALIILSGFTQDPGLLKGAILLFGGAAGVATISSIGLMLDLTTAENAGMFVGAWGLSQAIARGVGIFSGGVILDVGKNLLKTPLLAYSAVFAIQALCMVGAIAILSRVSVSEFRSNSRRTLATAMEADLDG
ncbi:MAG: BCD family MFS transporter [Spirulina sp. SIO3F2]|nr:BCD family MFS transporter [Spirulina sp. SIO3F2]